MQPICITVLAHQEERRIATCLESLPLGREDVIIHVVVNGSTDGTAAHAQAIADRTDNLVVHNFKEGGKSRSWNRFLFDTLTDFHPVHIFVDGDAEIVPGSIDALASALTADASVNAVAGMPCNGRRYAEYRAAMVRDHGLFGDLYGLQGAFLGEMKRRALRLPDDLIGDDGLIGAMAKTNLEPEAHWDNARLQICEQAGFLSETVSLWSPHTLAMQRKRMVNYSMRHFQNRMVSEIMRAQGPAGLPRQLASLYRQKLPSLTPRAHPVWWWFDRAALRRMAAQARAL